MIYLDHNATTPLDPRVRAAMERALDVCGNPSSVHAAGRVARDLVERGRQEVAALLSATPDEIVFTSGGTEGDHLAIRGLAVAEARRRGLTRGHLVTSPIEHPAVLAAVGALEGDGFRVTRVPVSRIGAIAVDDVRAAIEEETVLVTLAAVNHELGTLYPVRAFAAAAHERGALFHTDAVQAVGRLPFDVGALDLDAATLSAHKLHGPKGVGAVYVRRTRDLAALIAGGHQERGRRGGTENVPAIAGLAEACRLTALERAEVAARIERLGARLEARLLEIRGARLNGAAEGRAPGIANVGFSGADGRLVAMALDLEGICVSNGSACTSGSVSPSPVLLALGLSPAEAGEAVRFSVGRANTEEEIDRAAAVVARVVARVRGAELPEGRA